jgi:hypothetical protein
VRDAGDKLVASAGAQEGIGGEFVVTAETTEWTTGVGSAICGAPMTEGASITPGVATGCGVSVDATPFVGAVEAQCADVAPSDEVAWRETSPRGAHGWAGISERVAVAEALGEELLEALEAFLMAPVDSGLGGAVTGGSGWTPGAHDALAHGFVVGGTTMGAPCRTIGGDLTGACCGGVTGLVVGPLPLGLFAGLLCCFTYLGCGVGWPMEPIAWRGVMSDAVMPAPEKVNDCAAYTGIAAKALAISWPRTKLPAQPSRRNVSSSRPCTV